MPESTNDAVTTLDDETPGDESLPWEQQPGESNLWFSRYHIYLLLGPTRSLLEAYNADLAKKSKEKQSSPSSAYSAAAKQWLWKERAAAYDAHQRELEQKQYEQEREELWKSRKQQFQETTWGIAEKLTRRVETMLAFPLEERVVEKTHPDGQPNITVIKPANWSYASISRLMACANQTARLATDLETARILGDLKKKPDADLISETEALLDGDPAAVEAGAL